MPKDRREPLLARVSLFVLLLNLFVWAGLRNIDILLVAFLSTVLGLTGLISGYRAKHKIHRQGGRVSGETMALIGYWLNLLVFIFSALLLAFVIAIGVLRGEFL